MTKKTRGFISTLWLLILCLAVSCLFAGCGGEGSQDTQPTETEAVETTEATEPTTVTEPMVEAVQPQPDPEVPMLDLYISPNGSDSNDGRSAETPMLTLTAVSNMLVLEPFDGNITIHMAEGKYHLASSTTWSFASPGHTIYFEGAGQDKTVFEGQMGADINFMTVSACSNTSYSFRNFTVRLVRNGIIMRNSSDGSVLTQEGVTGWFENLTFEELGGYYTRNPNGAYAGIQFLGSSNNTIKNCRFVKMRDYSSGNYIHAVYISTFSSNNLIQNCHFEDARPDPVRIRRGSCNNTVEYCTFINTGYISYCSTWNAGDGEPEPCLNNLVRYCSFHGGYDGLPVATIAIFKDGTSTPAPQDPEIIREEGNTVYPSQYDPIADASCHNYTIMIDGKKLDQKLPVFAMDRYENYINLDDMAVLLKGTDFAFTYSIPEEITQYTVSLNNLYTGDTFTTHPNALEGAIKCKRVKEWTISNFRISKGLIYEYNGAHYVSLEYMQQLLVLADDTAFKYEVIGDTIIFKTQFEDVEVPETVPVYMLKVPGSFTELGANNGRYSLANTDNFTVVLMDTKDLDHLIRFKDLVRAKMDYVIVGIPIGNGTWGIREWKNNAAEEFYYYGDDRVSGLNRSWKEASNGYADCFYKNVKDLVFYTVVPVGKDSKSAPQYRIKENWTTGSLTNFTELFLTDGDKFVPIQDFSSVTVSSMAVALDGKTVAGAVPVYHSAMGSDYLLLADMAALLKDTDNAFTFAVDAQNQQITLTKGAGFTGGISRPAGNFSVTDWTKWTILLDGNSTTVSGFEHNGNCYVEPGAFAEALGIFCNVNKTGITILSDLALPETIDVLMLNNPGKLDNRYATDIEQTRIKMDLSAFTVVPTSTEELSKIINLNRLRQDGFQYVIVGIELKGDIWGVREFKNNGASSYYTYADRKWSSASGGFSDWFYNASEDTVYYMILPIGVSASSEPQLRIKQGWESGGPGNYTQILFQETAKFEG